MDEPYELNGLIQTAVSHYSKTVAKTAFAYVKNITDAEDITQEVFLTLMQKRPSVESEEYLKAWLIRVSVNKSKNHLKSGWLRSGDDRVPEAAYLSTEQSDLLLAVLSLEVKYRIPIHPHYYEGYSIHEIAGIPQEKPATIGTWLARGRKRLKDMIGGALR